MSGITPKADMMGDRAADRQRMMLIGAGKALDPYQGVTRGSLVTWFLGGSAPVPRTERPSVSGRTLSGSAVEENFKCRQAMAGWEVGQHV